MDRRYDVLTDAARLGRAFVEGLADRPVGAIADVVELRERLADLRQRLADDGRGCRSLRGRCPRGTARRAYDRVSVLTPVSDAVGVRGATAS